MSHCKAVPYHVVVDPVGYNSRNPKKRMDEELGKFSMRTLASCMTHSGIVPLQASMR